MKNHHYPNDLSSRSSVRTFLHKIIWKSCTQRIQCFYHEAIKCNFQICCNLSVILKWFTEQSTPITCTLYCCVLRLKLSDTQSLIKNAFTTAICRILMIHGHIPGMCCWQAWTNETKNSKQIATTTTTKQYDLTTTNNMNFLDFWDHSSSILLHQPRFIRKNINNFDHFYFSVLTILSVMN